jgi:hypothetical protein
MEDMPVIRTFMAQQTVIPMSVMLFVLLLAVWLDAYLSRERKRVMVIIVLLVFSLILQNYLEYRVSLQDQISHLTLQYVFVVRWMRHHRL